MAGIYIHIPFCKQLCIYCDFYSVKSLARKDDVLSAMHDELKQRSNFITDKNIETIYFGGGTPSLCTAEELGTFITQISHIFDTSQLKEITVEANPDDLTPYYLKSLQNQGINRLSIGIQSFIDRDLQWMNRRHDSDTARKAVKDAQIIGFDNITIDLIYGIPGMSTEEWQYNLKEALNLDVQHISAYHLTFEDKTVLGHKMHRGEIMPVEETESEKQFAMLHNILTEAGYKHYEVSNFAKPGFRAIHNSNYWFGKQYLGIGPSAHSYNGIERQWNVSSIMSYLRDEPSGTHSESESLTVDMMYNEYIMTHLRTDKGVNIEELVKKFGTEKMNYFIEQSRKFTNNGIMIHSYENFIIPSEKYLISDSVISDMFWQ